MLPEEVRICREDERVIQIEVKELLCLTMSGMPALFACNIGNSMKLLDYMVTVYFKIE